MNSFRGAANFDFPDRVRENIRNARRLYAGEHHGRSDEKGDAVKRLRAGWQRGELPCDRLLSRKGLSGKIDGREAIAKGRGPRGQGWVQPGHQQGKTNHRRCEP